MGTGEASADFTLKNRIETSPDNRAKKATGPRTKRNLGARPFFIFRRMSV